MNNITIISFHGFIFLVFLTMAFFNGAINESRKAMLQNINCERLLMMSISQLSEIKVNL